MFDQDEPKQKHNKQTQNNADNIMTTRAGSHQIDMNSTRDIKKVGTGSNMDESEVSTRSDIIVYDNNMSIGKVSRTALECEVSTRSSSRHAPPAKPAYTHTHMHTQTTPHIIPHT
jgi:hypothetical protein